MPERIITYKMIIVWLDGDPNHLELFDDEEKMFIHYTELVTGSLCNDIKEIYMYKIEETLIATYGVL